MTATTHPTTTKQRRPPVEAGCEGDTRPPGRTSAAADRVRSGAVGFAGGVIRPDDQVRLTFELVNGSVDPASNRIVALEPDDHVFYVVSFGSQHTAEATIPTSETPPDAPLGHRRAGPTRISVEIPTGTEFTVGNLLDLAGYALQVDPRADGADGADGVDGDPRVEPAADVTSIEVPASLILSPSSTGRFAAAPQPIVHGDVSEMWRARLTTADADGSGPPTLRAIARRSDETGFPADDLDRVVEQTTGPAGLPLQVSELSLSSQGSTIDVDGAWPQGLLAAYRHCAINGRDLRVEVVTRGYIAPFGHAASLTTLTERDLRNDQSGDLTASLIEDTYVSIGEPTVSYPADSSIFMPHQGRGLPFTTVTATDNGRGPVGQERIVLPNGSPINSDTASVLTRDGDDLLISYTATDRAGQGGITFDLPAVFVADTEAYEVNDTVGGRKSVLAKLATWYAEAADDSRRDLQLAGQAIGWADASPRGGSGSVQTTNRIRISFDRPDTSENDPADVAATLEDLRRPAFYPRVAAAWIVDLASTSAFGGDPPEIEVWLAARWLEHGIGDLNVDLGYLDLVTPTVVLPSTDALGMLAASLNIDTFGQLLGGGLKLPEIGGEGVEWMWDALDALGGIGGLPKLLGSLDLTDLIPKIDLRGSDAAKRLPTVSIEPQFDHPDVPEIPTGVCFHFSWEPEVQSFPTSEGDPKTFVVTADFEVEGLPAPGTVFDGDDTRVLLALTSCIPQATTTFEARLERFGIQLPPGAPVVALLFQHVIYANNNGSSSVDTKIADWLFINALSWLEPLKDLLEGLLDNGAPTFEGGIFVDYGIPIPGFSLGILGVSGLRVDLGLDLPDTGASSIDLAVGRRDDPFRITIMGFGGDGSFGLEVDASQIVLIEGSLAVTYELAVDVFIVSASLSASLGVYVEFERTDQFPEGEVTLGAYAELSGSVSLIGIVELSGSVTVGLEYNINTKVLRGCAAVTAEVSSIFGKTDVTRDVEVEVRLGTAGGQRIAALLGASSLVPADADDGKTANLSFRDRYTRSQWTTYCAAFAA